MAEISDFDAIPDLVADRARPPSERTRLGGAGALVAAVGLVAFPGGHAFVAVVGGLVVLAAWYLLAPTFAFALGHVALAAILPAETFAQGSDLAWVVAVEAGLVGILLASAARRSPASVDSPNGGSRWASLGRAVVGAGLVLGWVALGVGLAWASARSSLGLPTAAGLLVVAAALAAYGLHRYQLVSLGLVDEGRGDEGNEDEGSGDERDEDERRGDESGADGGGDDE